MACTIKLCKHFLHLLALVVFQFEMIFQINVLDFLLVILAVALSVSNYLLLSFQEVVISVLMKLAGGCPSLSDQLNVDAFLEQARSYDKASSNPIGWYIRFWFPIIYFVVRFIDIN